MDLLFSIALSAHIGFDNDYNAIHPNIRLQHNDVIAGVYYNSLEKISFYFGKEKNITDNFSVEIGIVTGYGQSDKDLFPMFRLKYNDYFVMPGEENGDIHLVLGREWTF